MKRTTCAFLGWIGIVAAVATPAAAGGITAEEGRATLAARVGTYHLTAKFWPEPGGEPQVSTLESRRRMILEGRVLESEVGPDRGFQGTGLMGFDEATGRFWYVWTDTSTGGVSTLEGSLHARGGTLEGRRATPQGPSPLRIEIRKEGSKEMHDYFAAGEDGKRVRYLELTFVPAG